MERSPKDDTDIVFRGEVMDSVKVERDDAKSPVISTKGKFLEEDSASLIPTQTPGRRVQSKTIRAVPPYHVVDSSKSTATPEIRSINEMRHRSFSPEVSISNRSSESVRVEPTPRNFTPSVTSPLPQQMVHPVYTDKPMMQQMNMQQPMMYPQPFPQQQMYQPIMYVPVQVQQPPPPPTKPNYGGMSGEEKADVLGIFKSKFFTLRNNYPEKNFETPDWENISLDTIHDIYESYVKSIIVETNSSQFRLFLVIMFLAIEYFGVKYLGIDLNGYTVSQMNMLKKYDRLLIELGEKYGGGTGGLSPEIRLMFMVIVNALIMAGVKVLSKNFGGGDGSSMYNTIIPLIGGTIDNMTAPAEKPSRRDKTFTNEPPKKTGGEHLIRMAAQTFGGGESGDLAEAIGNIGGNFLNNMNNPSKPKATTKPRFNFN